MMEMTLCVDDEQGARRALGLEAVELAGVPTVGAAARMIGAVVRRETGPRP